MSKEETDFISIDSGSVKYIADMAKELKVDPLLLVRAVPGGCSGLSYKMEFISEEDLEEGDDVLAYDGIKLVVDGMSKPFLAGITIKYVDGEEPYLEIENPNVKKSEGCCGGSCGEGSC